jgi:hypothetical protein
VRIWGRAHLAPAHAQQPKRPFRRRRVLAAAKWVIVPAALVSLLLSVLLVVGSSAWAIPTLAITVFWVAALCGVTEIERAQTRHIRKTKPKD